MFNSLSCDFVFVCTLVWDTERWITLRKASFCSRCLLIRGRRWSLSADIPSLSWLPHQSSSRRYSCSRLSNTLHTWTRHKELVTPLQHLWSKLRLNSTSEWVWVVPVQTSCRRPQRRWPAWGGPPSSASAAASGLLPSSHTKKISLQQAPLKPCHLFHYSCSPLEMYEIVGWIPFPHSPWSYPCRSGLPGVRPQPSAVPAVHFDGFSECGVRVR